MMARELISMYNVILCCDTYMYLNTNYNIQLQLLLLDSESSLNNYTLTDISTAIITDGKNT